jgi:SAM-dependent methyltransferase
MSLLPVFLDVAAVAAGFGFLGWIANFASYRIIKRRTLAERRWDYNICCGNTDGGGINADIVRHSDVPNFELVKDVTALPHADGAFEHVLCSHTLEHVDDPVSFYSELRRVGRNVTVLVPPLWDFTAALNPFEHRVIFLTMASRHDNRLPPFVRFLPARWLQDRMGQRVEADWRGAEAGRLRPVLDAVVPALLLAGAALFGMGLPWGLLPTLLGVLALWASKAHAGGGSGESSAA